MVERLVFALLAAPGLWFVQEPPAGSAQEPTPTIKARVEVVNILATVRDKKGHYVGDLTAEDFDVYEDGVKQQIQFFNYESGADAQPLTIVLALDTSGSVKEKLDFEQEAAMEFLRQTLRPNKDMAAVVMFDSELYLVQDFSFDLKTLEQAIQDIRAGGATKLYDAVFTISEDLLAYEVGRRVLVVLSDGADTQSAVLAEDAIRSAQRHDVLIYGIGVRTRGFDADFGKLEDFAKATGGLFFKSKTDLRRLREVFSQINKEIKNQFSLGYVSTNKTRDGGFRRVEVKVRRRGLKVTHRKGYYAEESTS